MRFHSQNLTDDRLPTWRHGRAWWGNWRAEWLVFMRPSFKLGLHAGGYEDNELQVCVSLFLFTLYLSRGFRHYFEDRELCVYWFEGSLWLKLWCDGDWHRDRPWHRNTIALHVREWITGSPKYSTAKGEPVSCVVPMPEGSYRATATPVTSTWTYRFGFKKTREWVDLRIDGCIPFQGKGENSWDCGDDGLCGIGGKTLEEAIGNAVASALKSRRRYGETRETEGRIVFARPEAEAAS